ncbi:MAG: hypothetical protein PHY43_07375 [Verrucomicrobiales bacterium]|nr:hypothetical protein [Verrucomicrobiales bacterium]
MTLSKNYDGIATNEDHGDIRVIAFNSATNGWRDVPFDTDLNSYFSPAGTNSAYNQFYVEGLALGAVKLQVQLGGDTYAEQAIEVCTHTSKTNWQQEVRNEIYFDTGGTVAIENYLAGNGFMNNRTNMMGVYSFYEKLFTNRPTQFYWAGLAKLAGAPVYAGLSDAEYVKQGLFVAGFLAPNGANIPFQILSPKAGQFQQILIGMNIDIYSDLAWQFEAYRMGGLCALEDIAIAPGSGGLLDIEAWQFIDQGVRQNDSSLVQKGNRQLLQREQRDILKKGYADLSNLFPGTTPLMSVLAENPVPGGPSFSALEPGGNIANYLYRWDWITRSGTGVSDSGMWPLWLSVSQSTRLQWVAQPLQARAADYSEAVRLLNLPVQ